MLVMVLNIWVTVTMMLYMGLFLVNIGHAAIAKETGKTAFLLFYVINAEHQNEGLRHSYINFTTISQ